LAVIVLFSQSTNAEISEQSGSPLNVADPYDKVKPNKAKPNKAKPNKTKPSHPSKTKPSHPKTPKSPKTSKPKPPTHQPKFNPNLPKEPPRHPHNNTKPTKPIVRPTPIPFPPARVNPGGPNQPVPVTSSGGSCSGVCQDNSLDCDGTYLRGLCPGAANIQCCPASSASVSSTGGGGGGGGSSDDASVFTQVLQQPNTRVSVGTYSGVPNGFYQTQGRALLYTGKMDTDCDGAPSCPSIDPDGQTSTSFNYQGQAIDALRTNYFVLPSDLSKKLGSIYKLGDIAAVMYNGQVSYAIYADNGPLGKCGEGSVHLSLELGFNPYCGSRICSGISSGVSFLVFPGSRSQYTSPYDEATISAAGSQLLAAQVNN